MQIDLTEEELSCILTTLKWKMERIKQYGDFLNYRPKLKLENTLLGIVISKIDNYLMSLEDEEKNK